MGDNTSKDGVALLVTDSENSNPMNPSDGVDVISKPGSFQATRPALNTPEILSKILYHVQAQDLLVNVMRVSQCWKATIDTVPLLQQKPHFAPMPLEKQWYQDDKPLYSLCGLMAQTFCNPPDD